MQAVSGFGIPSRKPHLLWNLRKKRDTEQPRDRGIALVPLVEIFFRYVLAVQIPRASHGSIGHCSWFGGRKHHVCRPFQDSVDAAKDDTSC